MNEQKTEHTHVLRGGYLITENTVLGVFIETGIILKYTK